MAVEHGLDSKELMDVQARIATLTAKLKRVPGYAWLRRAISKRFSVSGGLKWQHNDQKHSQTLIGDIDEKTTYCSLFFAADSKVKCNTLDFSE